MPDFCEGVKYITPKSAVDKVSITLFLLARRRITRNLASLEQRGSACGLFGVVADRPIDFFAMAGKTPWIRISSGALAEASLKLPLFMKCSNL